MEEDLAYIVRAPWVVCAPWGDGDSWRATIIALYPSRKAATTKAKAGERIAQVRFAPTAHRLPWPGLSVGLLHDGHTGLYVYAEPERGHAVSGESRRRCFTACVADHHDCNPASHGDITFNEICGCGARRAVNVNQRFFEFGPWRLP